MSDRKTRGFGVLDDFQPKPETGHAHKAPATDAGGWPSREPREEAESKQEATISMRGPARVIDRFKHMAKSERYSQWEMIEILMDRFDKTGGFNAGD